VTRAVPSAMADRLIVALDVPRIDEARRLVERLDGIVSFYKIGLWLAFAPGIDSLIGDLLAHGGKLFLDCKMLDIPNTVEQGVARAAERGMSFVTVHAEPATMAAAVKGKRDTALKILAVTVLTSLGDRELQAAGYRLGADELVRLRVRQAAACGCDGIVASAWDRPDELRRLASAQHLLVVTPGIRPAGGATDDHRRAGTPAQAVADGADYLVVGRPITATADPAAAARAIIAEMEQGARPVT
jgi:orotidine-5'-phosphate decarboxylase